MALTYTVDSSLNIVFETWTGKVTAEGLRASWTRLMSDPAVQECRRHLADLREAEFALTGTEVSSAVTHTLMPRIKGKPRCSAIVVAGDLAYGTGRQFQVFAEAGLQTALFRDPDSALTWLLMQCS